MQFTLKVTQKQGELVVESEGEWLGDRTGPIIFTYEPSNPARVADLEIATIARTAYARLREMTLTEV